MPVVFPVHPRTRRRFERARARRSTPAACALIDPLGYLDFLALMDHAACVLTDSGGIQEETTVLGVPCLTLRDNTERPVTVDEGTNTLVMADGRLLPAAFDDLIQSGGKRGRVPNLWDGQAGRRTADVLTRYLGA